MIADHGDGPHREYTGSRRAREIVAGGFRRAAGGPLVRRAAGHRCALRAVGAEALGSDVDRRSLQAAAINAEINQLQPRWFVSDLMKQVPRARFEVVTFNAPLLKAQLANPDPAAPSSYYTSDRGEPLALEFF